MVFYELKSESLLSLLDDARKNFKLPRFQRKATWGEKKRFELCVSLFQGYPIGVIIVNEEKKKKWLLDGRQRLDTLHAMRENPIEFYHWAKSYLGFHVKADPDQLTEKFLEKIGKFIQSSPLLNLNSDVEAEDETDFEQDELLGQDYEETFYSTDESFRNVVLSESKGSSKEQKYNLRALRDLILIVHQIDEKEVSQLERTFSFDNLVPSLPYMREGRAQIKPLLSFMRDCIQEYNLDEFSAVEFLEYVRDKNVEIKDLNAFNALVLTKWRDIHHALRVIETLDETIRDAQIGVIRLKGATPLDAQSIFSRVNQGGEQLNAEELLSARPYWNKVVDNIDPDSSTVREVRDLYGKLGINPPSAQQIVRWDLAATLIKRIDQDHLIFPPPKKPKKGSNSNVDLSQVTLGFKLLSTFFEQGMANTHVIALEKNSDVENAWADGLDTLVTRINELCEVLLEDNIFRTFIGFKKPLASALGSAPALEFLYLVYQKWADLNFSKSKDPKLILRREAKVLLDKLIFEYATRQWRGSGDSRLAKDLTSESRAKRFEPTAQDDWLDFLNQACLGKYRDDPTSQQTLTPVLCYLYALNEQLGDKDKSWDVDHILPKAQFTSNHGLLVEWKNSLTNLAFLPRKGNNAKKSKTLKEINESWLVDEIEKYEYIKRVDFEKFSIAVNFKEELVKLRRDKLINIFKENREKVLSAMR